MRQRRLASQSSSDSTPRVHMKSTKEVNQEILQQIAREPGQPVRVAARKQDSIAVALNTGVRIEVSGDVGDFFGALNDGAAIRLKGNAGRFAGDVMRGGEVVVDGRCQEGAGMYMFGGDLVIRGDAGEGLGQMCRGGAILVDGDAGDTAGLYLTGGNLVILGDSGEHTGEWMICGRIFVAGKIGSLGHNTVVEDLTDDDERFLTELLARHQVKAPLEGMKKVAPRALRPFYSGSER